MLYNSCNKTRETNQRKQIYAFQTAIYCIGDLCSNPQANIIKKYNFTPNSRDPGHVKYLAYFKLTMKEQLHK